jgi:aspartyl-tRNA(Asn)/glutamyl-tRNA(Gln) amidotransferase subunit C
VAVSDQDVRHIAALARLGLPTERIPGLVAELNGILVHMDVLSQVDTKRVSAAAGVDAGGMPLRQDAGPQIALARPRGAFAPATRDGFFLVPRLSTHEAVGDDPVADDAEGREIHFEPEEGIA